jgi:hypothetical protein
MVQPYGSLIFNNHGAAIFYPVDGIIGDANDRHRESTLGENDNISTGNNTGWGL